MIFYNTGKTLILMIKNIFNLKNEYQSNIQTLVVLITYALLHIFINSNLHSWYFVVFVLIFVNVYHYAQMCQQI